MKISASIITLNEENNIERAISSVSWTDEIVVVDSGSSDRTVEIAKGLGAKVISQEWLGFGPQKQFAVDKCSHDWILSIDADEFVSKKLRAEIETLKETKPENLADGYQISRLTEYMGRQIKHSGWYPDYKLRFFNKKLGSWNNLIVHESVEMKSDTKVARLRHEIGHLSVRTLIEHHHMIGERYAPLGADQMRSDGKRTSVVKIVTALPGTFFRSYFLRLGILDGFPGFCIAVFAGYNSFLKHLLRSESQHSDDQRQVG